MPLFSQHIVAKLAPTNLDGYVKRILDERRDDVTSELGLTRTEIPFFNVSSDLSHLLILNKLYKARLSIAGAIDMLDTSSYDPPALLQDELNKIIKEVNHIAHHHDTKVEVHILDLSYFTNRITPWILSKHENAQGLGIKFHRDVTDITGEFEPQSHARLTVCDGDVLRIETVQKVIECYALPYTASTGRGNTAGFDIILASAVLLLKAHEPRARFAYSQLLLAMQNIALGGGLVIALEMRPLGYVVEIINILHQSFESITVVDLPQTTNLMVYIACRRFGASDGLRRMHSSRIRELLRDTESPGQHVSMG
ncbi:hypothetical protein C8Q72DRAFT_913098 [Fomitopsis betulina]|nr:hypothetical protein C8Q72DRAFT_913098 [Fomitopsis betulina]